MSAELEALATIHAEQGYLIINSRHPHEPGDVIRDGSVTVNTPDGGVATKQPGQPVTVVGVATLEEFLRQNLRLDQLLGVCTSDWKHKYPRFYKTVATD